MNTKPDSQMAAITSPVNSIYLSLVVPCFNEEVAIPLFYNDIFKMCASINENFEIIFVDDGSRDNTLNILSQNANQDKHTHYISFSRNFGKEAAMLSGLQTAQAKYIVMLDADLQHPPTLIPLMLEEITGGEYDCIAAKRTRRGDSPLRSFFARCFYRVLSTLTGIKTTDGVGDFRLMTKVYVDAILQLEERNRFSKGIYPWIGFKTKTIEYENVARIAGATKWSFFKLFFYSVDGWTGIVCLIVFFSGTILLSIGVLGQYIAKIYTEIKRRPHFIIKESQ
jgi:glycosyltransferase involved in cell wall biosynthesis